MKKKAHVARPPKAKKKKLSRKKTPTDLLERECIARVVREDGVSVAEARASFRDAIKELKARKHIHQTQDGRIALAPGVAEALKILDAERAQAQSTTNQPFSEEAEGKLSLPWDPRNPISS